MVSIEDIKSYKRAIAVLWIGMFAAIWVLINSRQWVFAAIVYLAIGGIQIYVYTIESLKKGAPAPPTTQGWNRLVGIDKNIIFDIVLGVAVGTILIILSRYTNFFVIGLPTAWIPPEIAVMGKWIIVVICAPVFEEFLFRDKLLNLVDKELFDSPFVVAVFINALAFSIYHFVAYGAFLQAMGASFIGAFFVGFALCYVRKYSNSILPPVIAHILLNASILSVAMAVLVIV